MADTQTTTATSPPTDPDPLSQDTYESTVLDLHDLALLLTYERGATEPRFRHAKLREVAAGPGGEFQTIRVLDPEWGEARRRGQERLGLVFDRVPPNPKSRVKAKGNAKGKGKEDLEYDEDEPDLPSNMLPQPIPPQLRSLTPKQLETYFWQARNHDGCFRTVALFQHLLDLFPAFTRIRVRTVEKSSPSSPSTSSTPTPPKPTEKPRTYTTLASSLTIIEFHLTHQRTLTLSTVLPHGTSYISGSGSGSDTGPPNQTLHAVLGFASPGFPLDTILDLAALQFGDAGRGCKGRGLFVLEPIGEYVKRLDRFAQGNTFKTPKLSERIRGAPDAAWLEHVAKRVKQRWENRAQEPWCGHCGAPPPRNGGDLKRCAKCKKAYYCDAEHQTAAWPFHKHFCEAD